MFTNVHLCRHAKCKKRRRSRSPIYLLLILLAHFSANIAQAQNQTEAPPSYPKATYNPLQPPPDNKFGVLYNWQNRQVQVPTQYHEMQSVWLTAYLPYIEHEYDPTQPAIPYGGYYTTGFALCSPRDPNIGLFAPIEITAVGEPGDLAIGQEFPVASVLPPGAPQLTYTGLFDKLHNLNEQEDPSLTYPVLSKHGTSALHAAQSFTRFMQHFFGHGGIDKDGLIPIKIVLRKSDPPSIVPSKEIYFTVETEEGLPVTSQSSIAYQIAFKMAGANNPGLGPNEHEASTILGSFSSIMALSFSNWENPTAKFLNPKWIPRPELGFLPQNIYGIPFNDPKLHGYPSTYKGKFWNGGLDQIAQNTTVMNHWFYLLNTQKSGHIDDDDEKGFFLTEPLIPNDKHATYELALKILYDAVVAGKINAATTFDDFRELTLQAAVKNNHPVGSDVYKRIMTAWYAVNVGPAPYTSNPNCAVTAQAESWFNGEVSFTAQEVSLTQDPQSAKALRLIDCLSPAAIETLEYDDQDVTTPMVFMNKNPLQNKIYGKTSDPLKSKTAVSIHKFTIEARNWFRDKFGHNGPDGNGKVYIYNILAHPEFPETDLASSNNFANFYYNYNKKSACRDEVSRTYALAVSLFKNFPAPTSSNFNEDTRIWMAGIANIFALATKRDYERALQNPDADHIWTLHEETADPALIMNFTNPKLSGQPAKLFGENWKPEKIKNNSGFINLFYYLLVHGTADENGQDVGYTNNEPGSKTYFVNPVKEDLVLKVLFEASRSVDVYASLEQFRQATMSTLHDLDPVHYHAKSKEHIAFHDAWAAVLGLPDYASSLALYPEEGTSVYPWPTKVGAEAEYPLYESYRLFEVSKSSTFNENEHPVHRFVNGVMQINMDTDADAITWAEANLEPGQVYHIRSHQADGPGARAHCATTDDPSFCESLLIKKKWTLPYSFKTEAVPAVVNLSPANGETVPAWSSIFSFGSTPGAAGYDMAVIDGSGTVSEQLVAINSPYDYEEPEQSQVIKTTLALSKEKPYTYRVAARQKLGSELAVHVLPNGLIYPFTEAEKEAFPDVYGDWTQDVTIKTDLPTIELQSPEDGAKVPLFGSPIDLKAQEESPKRADFYKLSIREPLMQEDLTAPMRTVYGTQLAGLADQKQYKWTITPAKKAELPFIPEDEIGQIPDWFHFIVDKEKVPAPIVTSPGSQCVAAGKKVVITWEAVPGAKGYEYAIIDLATNQEVTRDIVVGQTESPPISGATVYPKQYKQVVRAGIQDPNGNWVFGKEGTSTYAIRPETASNFTPQGPTISLGAHNSIHFGWQDALSTGAYHFTLRKHDPETNTSQTIVDTDFSGTDILVEELEFDTEYERTVHVVSANGCTSAGLSGTFVTEPEPVTIDPELRFKFQMLCSDALGWGILDPFIKYNFTIHDPNGNKIISEMGLSSVISILDEKLPVVDGVYTAHIIITEVDPVYTETDEPEGSVIMMLDLFNIANADKKLLDSDLLGGKFDPVKNLMLNLAFEVNTDNFTLSHRSNAEAGGQTAKKMVKIRSLEVKYPELELTVFPNPASSEVQIMPGLYKKGKPLPLQVYDQQGRLVMGRNWAGEKLQVSHLVEGTYIVKVQRGELMFSQKLIVTR
jgi:hypothetical protein